MAKTKAETSLERGLADLGLSGKRWTYQGPPATFAGGDYWAHTPGPLDTESLSRLLERYGSYLELIGEDQPVGKRRLFQWPPPPRRPTGERPQAVI